MRAETFALIKQALHDGVVRCYGVEGFYGPIYALNIVIMLAKTMSAIL
jgi:hypothetical protein